VRRGNCEALAKGNWTSADRRNAAAISGPRKCAVAAGKIASGFSGKSNFDISADEYKRHVSFLAFRNATHDCRVTRNRLGRNFTSITPVWWCVGVATHLRETARRDGRRGRFIASSLRSGNCQSTTRRAIRKRLNRSSLTCTMVRQARMTWLCPGKNRLQI